jgi:hypothetical protein
MLLPPNTGIYDVVDRMATTGNGMSVGRHVRRAQPGSGAVTHPARWPDSGYATALSHGVGVGLYGLITVAGLAALVTGSQLFFSSLQLAGAAYLIYLGIKSLRVESGYLESHDSENAGGRSSAILDGFLVVFLNPKTGGIHPGLIQPVPVGGHRLATTLDHGGNGGDAGRTVVFRRRHDCFTTAGTGTIT